MPIDEEDLFRDYETWDIIIFVIASVIGSHTNFICVGDKRSNPVNNQTYPIYIMDCHAALSLARNDKDSITEKYT